ncbi:CstA-like transporter-associated (seleno)protein [Yersinia intermedia]|uniref:CstA-like transporter-associated (seleno)protein n=1 Tax=Yersinia intermedia TaxID=631 RepID=UPI0005E694AF|nr:CstA-like transporter-associated (seleno)protein [Yersinia intermedia]MCB5311547.1 putative selenoprotein [Yersinia intermedia]MCB5325412.1 putative selenoprotein [Yersinia intermedia]CQJ52047.1 small protein yjiX [Yersinia intermedia]
MVNAGIPFRTRTGLATTPRQITRCIPLVPVAVQPTHLRAWLRLIAHRVAQSFRLMVGVQDYGNYVNHMHRHHPDTAPMTEREFHRYCLDARFPSKAGKLGKCPC